MCSHNRFFFSINFLLILSSSAGVIAEKPLEAVSKLSSEGGFEEGFESCERVVGILDVYYSDMLREIFILKSIVGTIPLPLVPK